MQYAVIKTGGKQYKVVPGDVIEVERLSTESGQTINFDEVLLVNIDGENHFGFPKVADALVAGKILDHFRGEKIRVSRFKSKVRYRRVTGHRQELSRVQIDSFSLGGKTYKPEVKAAPVQAESVASTVAVETASKETKTKTAVKRTVKKS